MYACIFLYTYNVSSFLSVNLTRFNDLVYGWQNDSIIDQYDEQQLQSSMINDECPFYPPYWLVVLIALSLVIFLMVLARFMQTIYTWFISPLIFGDMVEWHGGPNSWAIITGATDGLGLAYAKAMAEKGYCLLLLSRNQQKLDKVKTEILKQFTSCTDIRTLVVDFTQGHDLYDYIGEQIRSLPGNVHVLINNVGMAYKYPEYFTRILDGDKFITNIMNCNMVSVVRMTYLVLPLMEKQKSGIVLNISSFSALFPSPLLTLYSATKIFMDYFSRGLYWEYRHRGIIIQSVVPYYVTTNMIRNPGVSFMIPNPDTFVRSALKTVGHEIRTYGFISHRILAFVREWNRFFIGFNFSTRLAIRTLSKARKRCYQRKGLDHHV